jgi:hypothetical protein
MTNKSVFQKSAEQMKDQLGHALCLAKWKQVSLHLPTGLNNSCYHPPLHMIDPEAIKLNPGALHNTEHKKAQRRIMLQQERPAECSYCWNMEDQGKLSDRHYRSGEPWAAVDFEKIKNSSGDEDNVIPSYVEVNFNHACNLKCSYCSPQFSSSWADEVTRNGGYPTSTTHNDPSHFTGNRQPIPVREHNPYVEAFWSWWPELYNDLDNFRITGGEPLLSKDTWKVLDYMLEQKNPNRKLKFAINTNLGVEDNLIDRLIEKLDRIINEDRVEEVILFTSIDAYGKHAEYIRNGLDTERFWNNIDKILTKLPKVTITVMSTYNLLSPFSYNDLINKIYEVKVKHQNQERYWAHAILLDTSYLRYPKHQSVKLLSNEHKELILKNAEEALYLGTPSFDRTNVGMTEVEITKIKRIYDWVISEPDEDFSQDKMDFISFVDEHDKRRGTNFLKTFPELTEFYNTIKNGN